jgi:hypothetical protein
MDIIWYRNNINISIITSSTFVSSRHVFHTTITRINLPYAIIVSDGWKLVNRKGKQMNLKMDKTPYGVAEALQIFVKSLNFEEKKAMMEIEEDQVAIFHFTLGTDLRWYWSMTEQDTPLVNSFKGLGITHPDDMSSILLTSAWRQLHKKPLKINEQVKKYQDYWKKEIGKPMP